MAEVLQQFGGWIVGLLAVVGTIFYNNRKVEVDQSALILGKWKDLVDSHQADIRALKEEFSNYKREASEEASALRKRLSDVETEFAEYKLIAARHIAARDEEIAGLKAAIRQNSQSAAHIIGEVQRASSSTDEHIGRVETENSEQHDQFSETLRALDNLNHNSRGRVDGDGK